MLLFSFVAFIVYASIFCLRFFRNKVQTSQKNTGEIQVLLKENKFYPKKSLTSLLHQAIQLHIERKSANRFIFVSLWLNCRFYSLQSGVDRYFSWNCDVGFWHTKQQHKFRAYLLIKQSLLLNSTDIQRLFEKYLSPPGRRFGIIKPLTLDESPACLKEPR